MAVTSNTLMEIEAEIAQGLAHERQRLDEAMFNLEFYRADFERFPPRAPSKDYDAMRYSRTAPIMQKIVKTLTANLYAVGPQRFLKAPVGVAQRPYQAATVWLDQIYRSNAMNAFWQEADRLATATDWAAFQVSATADPAKPVRISLWDASELVVWTDPDDPLAVIAVATLDVYGTQRRLRLYTPQEVSTWLTKEWNPTTPNGATTYQLETRQTNPYGVIPFSFVHFEFPTSSFFTGGPGSNLREVNDGINFFMTEQFDCLRYNARPVIVLKNVRAGWSPNRPIGPGDIWDLPAGGDGSEDNPPQDATYLQADVSFVAAGWDDCQAYLDLVLEMYGIPAASIRLTQSSSQSGVAIVAEQIPMGLWAESRERPFSYYEDDLARLCLHVGSKHLGNQRYADIRATAAQLEAVSQEPGLVLHWPSMYVKLPGEQRDKQDQWLLDNHLTSRTRVLMDRENLTKEEAFAMLAEIAEELEAEQELFAFLTPPGLEPPALNLDTESEVPPGPEDTQGTEPGDEEPDETPVEVTNGQGT